MSRQKKFKTNSLYTLANKYRQLITEEDKIERIDMTQPFFAELEAMVTEGEIIICNINAKMRLGKSTIAMALGIHTFGLLQKHGMRDKKEEFNITNIARDQLEKARMMRNPNFRYTVAVTDESDEMENSGENVSTEKAQAKMFSDVQAGRYVHAFDCSPKETIDPNADIMLSVIAKDEKTCTSRCKLYYRFYEGGVEHTQLLGYVDIYVGNVIKEWLKIKKIFYKKYEDRTKEEHQLLYETACKDFYVLYQIRKYQKMALITKHGVLRPRTLVYAEALFEALHAIKKLCKLGQPIKGEIVRAWVKSSYDKKRLAYSIVGIELGRQEIQAIVDQYVEYYKIQRQVKDLKLKLNNLRPTRTKTNITPEKKLLNEKLAILEEGMDALIENAQLLEQEIENKVLINSIYSSTELQETDTLEA